MTPSTPVERPVEVYSARDYWYHVNISHSHEWRYAVPRAEGTEEMSERQNNTLETRSHEKGLQSVNETNETLPGRPVGVMLIAGLCLFSALLVSANLFFNVLEPDGVSRILTQGPLGFGISLVLVAFFLATAIGLLRLHEWGRYLAVTFLCLSIVTSGIDSFSRFPSQAALMLAFIRSLLPIALLLYLLHPGIRPAFRRHHTN